MAQHFLLALCGCIFTQALAQRQRTFCQDALFEQNPARTNPLNTKAGGMSQTGFCLDVETDVYKVDVRAGVSTSRNWCNAGDRPNNAARCNEAYATKGDGRLCPCFLDSSGACLADESEREYCLYASPTTCEDIYKIAAEGNLKTSITMNQNYADRCAQVGSSECPTDDTNPYVVPILDDGTGFTPDTPNTFITCAMQGDSCAAVGPINCKAESDLRPGRRLQAEMRDVCGEASSMEVCEGLYTYEGGNNAFLSNPSLPVPQLVLCEWSSALSVCQEGATCPYACEVAAKNLPVNVPGSPDTELKTLFTDSVLEDQEFCEADWFRRNVEQRCETVYTTQTAGANTYRVRLCEFDDTNNVATCRFGGTCE